MNNVNYKNIKKYAVGKIPTDPGYQQGQSVDVSQDMASPGYTYDTAASAYRSSIAPQAITRGIQGLSTIGSVVSNYTTKAAANAAQSAGQIGVKAGLNTVGQLAAGAGALYGGFSMYNDFQNFNNRLSGQDIQNTAGSSIQTKYGQQYKTYGAVDENGIRDYVNAQNSGDRTNLIIDSTNTGFSTGSLIGSFFPGYGTIIGGVLGAGVGALVGGIFGNKKAHEREEETNRMIENTKNAIAGYNKQSEGVASSKGLSDTYYLNNPYYADKGKVPQYSKGKPSGMVSKDEPIYNPLAPVMEQVQYLGSADPNKKDERKDSEPLYGNIDAISILGHQQPGFAKPDQSTGIQYADQGKTGKYYADLGRPFAKRAKQIRYEFDNTTDPNQKLQLMQEMNVVNNNVRALAQMQQDDFERNNMKHTLNYKRINADKGKPQRFWNGKQIFNTISDYALPIMSGALQLQNLDEYKRYVNSQKPQMQPQSYVPVDASKYMRMMTQNIPDPTEDLKDVDNGVRENIYNVNQAGGLNSAQKRMLIGSMINQAKSTKSKIRQDYNNRKYAIYKDTAQMGSGIDLNNASRLQQDNLARNEQYARAEGAQWNSVGSVYHSTPTVLGSIHQNFDITKNNLGMMNLLNKKADTDRIAVTGNINTTSFPTAQKINYKIQPDYTINYNPINPFTGKPMLTPSDAYGYDYIDQYERAKKLFT